MSEIRTMRDRDMQKISAQQKVFKTIGIVLIYAFLFLMALIVLFPFYWMIISSLKEMGEYRQTIPTLFPEKIDWMNYVEVFQNKDLVLGQLFYNTMYVGIVSTALSLVITVLQTGRFCL